MNSMGIYIDWFDTSKQFKYMNFIIDQAEFSANFHFQEHNSNTLQAKWKIWGFFKYVYLFTFPRFISSVWPAVLRVFPNSPKLLF